MKLELTETEGRAEIANIPTRILSQEQYPVNLNEEESRVLTVCNLLETILTDLKVVIGGYPTPGKQPKKIEISIRGRRGRSSFSCSYNKKKHTLNLILSLNMLDEGKDVVYFYMYHELLHPFLPEITLPPVQNLSLPLGFSYAAIEQELRAAKLDEYTAPELFGWLVSHLSNMINNTLRHYSLTQISLISLGTTDFADMIRRLNQWQGIHEDLAKHVKEKKFPVTEFYNHLFISFFIELAYFFGLKSALPAIETIRKRKYTDGPMKQVTKNLEKNYSNIQELQRIGEKEISDFLKPLPNDFTVATRNIKKLLELYRYDSKFDEARVLYFVVEMTKIFSKLAKKYAKKEKNMVPTRVIATPMKQTEIRSALSTLRRDTVALRKLLLETLAEKTGESEDEIRNTADYTTQRETLIQTAGDVPGCKSFFKMYDYLVRYDLLKLVKEKYNKTAAFPQKYGSLFSSLGTLRFLVNDIRENLVEHPTNTRDQAILSRSKKICEGIDALEQGYIQWGVRRGITRAGKRVTL